MRSSRGMDRRYANAPTSDEYSLSSHSESCSTCPTDQTLSRTQRHQEVVLRSTPIILSEENYPRRGRSVRLTKQLLSNRKTAGTNPSQIRIRGLEAFRKAGWFGPASITGAFLLGAFLTLAATHTRGKLLHSRGALIVSGESFNTTEVHLPDVQYAPETLPPSWNHVPFSCRIEPRLTSMSDIEFLIKTKSRNFDRFRIRFRTDSGHVIYEYEGFQSGIALSSNSDPDDHMHRVVQWDRIEYKSNSIYAIEALFRTTNSLEFRTNGTAHKMFSTLTDISEALVFTVDGDLEGILRTRFPSCHTA